MSMSMQNPAGIQVSGRRLARFVRGIAKHRVAAVLAFLLVFPLIAPYEALVIGAAANDALYHGLADRDGAPVCHLVGDAMAPRRMNDAIREGELIARRI